MCCPVYPWQLLHRLGLKFVCTKDLFLYHFSGLWRFSWMSEGSHTIAEVGGLCQSPGDSGHKRPPHLPTADFSHFFCSFTITHWERTLAHYLKSHHLCPKRKFTMRKRQWLVLLGYSNDPFGSQLFAASIYLDLPSLRLSGSWTYLEWNIHGFSRGRDVLTMACNLERFLCIRSVRTLGEHSPRNQLSRVRGGSQRLKQQWSSGYML